MRCHLAHSTEQCVASNLRTGTVALQVHWALSVAVPWCQGVLPLAPSASKRSTSTLKYLFPSASVLTVFNNTVQAILDVNFTASPMLKPLNAPGVASTEQCVEKGSYRSTAIMKDEDRSDLESLIDHLMGSLQMRAAAK